MNIDLSDVAELYSGNVREMGRSPESVGWNDEASQKLRFNRLLRGVNSSADSITINDLGCGYGALYIYLTESTNFEIEQYIGYDVSDEMLEQARQLIGDNDNVDLYSKNQLTETADYSFASGIFNVQFEHSQNNWTDYTKHILQNMADHSAHGFAFNALTTHVDYMEDHLYYADPGEYLNYCLEEFSHDAMLFHDYDLYEWTITVSNLK
jgi:SAM-dependent methyltransferase